MPTRNQALQFQTDIIDPTIRRLGLYSPAASELLLGTAIQESNLTYRKQMGGGPALGLWQMEPVTYEDCFENYLFYRPDLQAKVLQIADATVKPEPEEMALNDAFACAMARIKYLRTAFPLPPEKNTVFMAKYWKDWYNSADGAGSEASYVNNWNRVMNNGYSTR